MARSRHPGAVRRYREEGGEGALGTTALFPRASRHTQHQVVSEKLSLPSWEHHPLASLPTTSSETEQQGEQGQMCMRMLYLQHGQERPLEGAVTSCHTAFWNRVPWAQSTSAHASWGKLLTHCTGP